MIARIRASLSRRTAARRGRSARPRLEVMERREVMSVATLPAIPFAAPAAASAAATTANDPDATLKTATRMGTVKAGWKFARTDAIELPASTTGADGKPLNWGQYVWAKSKDVDVYQFTAAIGDRARFDVDTWRLTTTWTDPKTGKAETKTIQAGVRLALFDAAGNPLNSDGGDPAVTLPVRGSDPLRPRYTLEYTFHWSGVYYLAVSHTKHSKYNLTTGAKGGPPEASASYGPYRLEARYVRKDLPDLVAVSAEVVDMNTIVVRYRNDGVSAAPFGPLKVGVYRSKKPTFDPASAELVNIFTIPSKDRDKRPSGEPGFHEVSLPALTRDVNGKAATALPNPFRPYVFVKIDPPTSKPLKAWPDHPVSNGAAPELSEANNATRVDDSKFRVPSGQITFNSEPMAKNGHLIPHWPGGSSGVTIGYGYDMRMRSAGDVTGDLKAVGVASGLASEIAAAHGLTGGDAGKFAADWKKAGKPGLTLIQARDLFIRVYPKYEAAAKKVYDRWTMPNGIPLPGRTPWEQLKPAIRDVLVDLIYQGINHDGSASTTSTYNAMYLDPNRNPMRRAMGNATAPLIALIESESSIRQYENARHRADYLRQSGA